VRSCIDELNPASNKDTASVHCQREYRNSCLDCGHSLNISVALSMQIIYRINIGNNIRMLTNKHWI